MSHSFTDSGTDPFDLGNREYAPEEEAFDLPELRPLSDLVDYMKEYARENPELAALTCFGVGFVLGWKLKPW